MRRFEQPVIPQSILALGVFDVRHTLVNHEAQDSSWPIRVVSNLGRRAYDTRERNSKLLIDEQNWQPCLATPGEAQLSALGTPATGVDTTTLKGLGQNRNRIDY